MSIICWLVSPSYLLLAAVCATAALGSVLVVAIHYLRGEMRTPRRTSIHCKCSAGFLELSVVGWHLGQDRIVITSVARDLILRCEREQIPRGLKPARDDKERFKAKGMLHGYTGRQTRAWRDSAMQLL